MTARLGIVFVLFVLATVFAVAPGTRVGAATTVDAGWWTSAPVAVAPDAPSGGLVVQGGSRFDRPFSYAAVAYTLAEGEAPKSVTLTVAANSASVPSSSLTVCPLTKRYTPAQGGAMADAPSFACTTKATASPSADGKSYTFNVAGLARNGALALAILPSAAANRVVLNKPTLDWLTSTAAGNARAANGSSVTSEAAADATNQPSPLDRAAVGAATYGTSTPTDNGPVGVPSTPAPGVSGPTPATETAPAQPAPAARSASSTKSTDHSTVLTLVFIALPLLAAALWLSAGAAPDATALPDGTAALDEGEQR